MTFQRTKKYEEYAYVLDVLRPERAMIPPQVSLGREEMLVHLIGDEFFTLLEATVPGKNMPSTNDRLYVGKDVPRHILRIIRRIFYNDLTQQAKADLESVVTKIVTSSEGRFIHFFNNANPVTPRLHSLELIHGVGKKSLEKILEEREQQLFRDYEDLKKRAGIADPVKSVVRRILDELTNQDMKYYLFAREPYQPAEEKTTRIR